MAHLLEDIVDSFKYFRDLRINGKIKKEIEKNIKSGNYSVFNAILPEKNKQNKGDKK